MNDLMQYSGTIYAWVFLWLFSIAGLVQALKRVVDPAGFKHGEYLTRKIAPIVFGILTAPAFGPDTAAVMGMHVSVLSASLLLGPGAGLAAMGAFALLPQKIKDALNGGENAE